MATKKKSAAKKTATGKKGGKLQNLSKAKRAMTANQLEAVKGGAAYQKWLELRS
jgi:hypothetical protein